MSDTKQKMTPTEQESVHLLVLKRSYELMTSAFSLVAALAWNDAIQSCFKLFFGDAASVYVKFLYAALITFIVVFIGTRLTAISKVAQKKFGSQEAAERSRD